MSRNMILYTRSKGTRKEGKHMYQITNTRTKETVYYVGTLQEALELCWFYEYLTFSYVEEIK